jgi:hypothetical protein
MKCLSVRNPWAALIASGRKTIELRTWDTSYRGELIIVSSAAPERGDDAKPWAHITGPLSRAVALVRLADIRPATKRDAHASCVAKMPPGYFAWLLEDLRPLDCSMHIKGQLSLYAPPPALRRWIEG